MANSDSSIVSIVGILAILILVGLAAYFILRQGDDSELEVDVNGQSEGAPAYVAQRTAALPAPDGLRFAP